MKKTLAILLLALSLNAFAAPDRVYEAGDSYKLTAKEKAQAVETVKKALKDPYSAKFEGEVKLATNNAGGNVQEVNGNKIVSVCVPVNSKNGFGAYMGMRYTLVSYRIESGSMTVLFTNDVAQTVCNK